jgi:hypothetical protein
MNFLIDMKLIYKNILEFQEVLTDLQLEISKYNLIKLNYLMKYKVKNI